MKAVSFRLARQTRRLLTVPEQVRHLHALSESHAASSKERQSVSQRHTTLPRRPSACERQVKLTYFDSVVSGSSRQASSMVNDSKTNGHVAGLNGKHSPADDANRLADDHRYQFTQTQAKDAKPWLSLNGNGTTPNPTALAPVESNSQDIRRYRGSLPAEIGTLEIQKKRLLARLRQKTDDLDKYEFLSGLRASNTDLFYRLLIDHISELLGLVYTPTIGLACLSFSHIFAYVDNGLYLSWHDKGHLQDIINSYPGEAPQIAVATDGSRILGLGDLGVNGMGIPIGKLSLYVACAGIDPSRTLPIVFDLGTANAKNLQDPLYVGIKQPRVSNEQAQEFISEFMVAVSKRWPQLIVQFEDLNTELAFDVLASQREQYPCFNDDIQGTAAVCLAGIINAIKQSGSPLRDHKLVFFGAGSAAVGIAQLICEHFVKQGVPEETARRMFWLVDSKGLVADNRGDKLPAHKVYFSRPEADAPRLTTLLSVVQHVRPTALLGLSTVGSTFTEDIVRFMAEIQHAPIIFPLSNPSSKSECTFREAMTWSEGRAIFASGSPWPSERWPGKNNQGNNVFSFPGLGLGCIMAQVTKIPEGLVHTAAESLSISMNEEERNTPGMLYPSLPRIREISAVIAREVVKTAQALGVDGNKDLKGMTDAEMDAYIAKRRYDPMPDGRAHGVLTGVGITHKHNEAGEAIEL
ncbi:uncharacterized protein L969DRAFT_98187 [Mixia osmundae IAM 14324]|uniref:Malic enzyme n=1 Tax=Mixia osmundae (strain CBS 9802 / IAM 14324 / JCM 22182 / KY 12970) TaxID=764103 RepID=G7DY24_MIXOS|nr:uncharacterized protein L969DRAFT_98187 [Mixia osmundae IAM 14324]KEI41385.1 hypothetical protein L969DRAFT_98187 [Mixia osmundae IAM 14324]GAA95484.1 hypothetical protein E5Q_02138 [Mixia osmundae IAM 14324]